MGIARYRCDAVDAEVEWSSCQARILEERHYETTKTTVDLTQSQIKIAL